MAAQDHPVLREEGEVNRAITNIRSAITQLEFLIGVVDLMNLEKIRIKLLAIRETLAAADADIDAHMRYGSK